MATGAILKINDGKSLELRYTAKRAETLEKQLDTSLVQGLAKTDRVGVLVKYIACGADISEDEACTAYDELIESGGSMSDVSNAIVEALQNGGYIPKKAVDAAKKLEAKLRHETPQS